MLYLDEVSTFLSPGKDSARREAWVVQGLNVYILQQILSVPYVPYRTGTKLVCVWGGTGRQKILEQGQWVGVGRMKGKKGEATEALEHR